MIKVKYRGLSLANPEVSHIKEEITEIKKKIKGIKCSEHSTDSMIHLRFTKEDQNLDKYVSACCYNFENVIKNKIQESAASCA